VSTQRVIARLRPKLAEIPGIAVFMFPAQDVRVGGRQTIRKYQFTLWSSDIDGLQKRVSSVLDRVKQVPGVVDVTTDRDQGGYRSISVSTARPPARMGVRVQDIDNALNNSFSQRQISTIYGTAQQYRVILEVDRQYKRDPSDLARVYVPGNGTAQIPLSAVTRFERGNDSLAVNHQGQFPSITISYNLAPDASIEKPPPQSKKRSSTCICPTLSMRISPAILNPSNRPPAHNRFC
jgi:multidrug efflux pump